MTFHFSFPYNYLKLKIITEECQIILAKIGILLGSLRKESFSRKLAENVATLFPGGYETEIVEIGNLPLYNQDYDVKLQRFHIAVQVRRGNG